MGQWGSFVYCRIGLGLGGRILVAASSAYHLPRLIITYQSVLELGILIGPSEPLVPQLRSTIEVDRGNDFHIT